MLNFFLINELFYQTEWLKLDIFIHPNTPIGSKPNSKLIFDDFKAEDWSYKDNFVPKSFLELAKMNQQIYNENNKLLKFEWKKAQNKMIEKIQEFFFSKNYEILNLENFCSSFIFEGLSRGLFSKKKYY